MKLLGKNRYGVDALGKGVAILAIAFWVLSLIFASRAFSVVAIIYAVYFLYRMLSTKMMRRREENERFLMMIRRIQYSWQSRIHRFKLRKNYRLFTCHQCKQVIKVPKHKGNLMITCPRCGYQFKGRS